MCSKIVFKLYAQLAYQLRTFGWRILLFNEIGAHLPKSAKNMFLYLKLPLKINTKTKTTLDS